MDEQEGAAVKVGRRHSKKDEELIGRIKAGAGDIASAADELGADEVQEAAEAVADAAEEAGKSLEARPAPDGKSVKTAVTVKAQTADTLTIAGYGVVFEGVDLTGDTFAKSTNFWLDAMPGPRPVLYEHGFDEAVNLAVLGKTLSIEANDDGLWVEAELNRHNRYMRDVERLIASGALGWSSGSAGHLVRRETDGKTALITSWPILEFSLTPTPAEPRTLGVKEVRAVQKAVKALTLGEQADAVEDALETALAFAFPDSAWARDEMADMRAMMGGDEEECEDPALYVYADFAVAQVGVAYWRIPYAITGGQVVVSPQAEWQMVDMNWQPAKTAAIQEEEIDMTADELKALLKEATTEAAAAAATDAAQKVREEIEAEPPLKTAGVATPVVTVGKKDDDAFKTWLRLGDRAPASAKTALVEGTGANGGYLVPALYSQDIVVPLANQSYLRRAGARVININGTNSFNIPSLTYSAAATLIAEAGSFSETDPTLGQVTFVPYKFGKLSQASEEVVADSRFDVWNEILQPDYVQAFAEAENTYFTTGTGSSQPQGVITGATTGVTAASKTAFTPDELVSTYFALDYKYRPGAVWMMHDAVLAYIRKMKDAEGRYLWEPGLNGETNGTIMGRPIVTNNSMDSALTTGKKLVLFGNFSYYYIGDFAGFTIQRLVELYAATGQIGFRAHKRFDGHVMLAAAFQLLVLA